MIRIALHCLLFSITVISLACLAGMGLGWTLNKFIEKSERKQKKIDSEIERIITRDVHEEIENIFRNVRSKLLFKF